MKTSPWLASEDLSDGGGKFLTVTVKISGIFQNDNVTLDAGRIEKRLFSIGFEGIPKQMIVNATNRKILSLEFGGDTKKWIGKSIGLMVETGVRFGKKVTTGLRFISSKSGNARDLNAEVGLSDDQSPAMKEKLTTAPPAPESSTEEIEVELDETHGDD